MGDSVDLDHMPHSVNAVYSNMPRLFDPDCFNSHTSWLTDLDLYCLQKQGISKFSRTRVKKNSLVVHKISIYQGKV